MKAVCCMKASEADKSNVLIDKILPEPEIGDEDLLVEIKAVSVNPVDYKVRLLMPLKENEYKILGWDAAGIVKAVGKSVNLFKAGDEVWYAGNLAKQGSNSELQTVHQHIVSKKPTSLSFEEAAALPLTSLTAWELLFDRLQIKKNQKSTLLVVGAAGGVGSILVQLAKKLTSLTIIATASREESRKWLLDLGADHIIDHKKPMFAQLQELGINEVDYVAGLNHSAEHAEDIVACLKPQSKFGLIDDPQNFDMNIFKRKSISIHWEMMFTRALYNTPDLIKQHEILKAIADLVDQGQIKTTLNEQFGLINALNINKAHELLVSGKARGKIVLSGF